MKKHFLWLLFFLMIFSGRAWALLVTTGGPKAYGYVMWHERYLLFAARVEDSLLSGTSTEPQVFPGNDDGIELCFDVVGADGKHTTSRLVISVAGGVAIFTRDENGRWRTENSWLQPPAILKFSVAPDGSLNDPSDRDRSFTVEVAIPWERLGGTPKPMATAGFNFLVRVRGENHAFVSWAQGVMSEEDNQDPSRWGAMLFFPGVRPAHAKEGVLACPRTSRVPFVDGKLIAEEWLGAAILTLEKPKPEFQPSPQERRKREEMPLLMTLYRYDYLCSGNSTGNGNHANAVVTPSMPVYQPREGIGPWWSADRPEWHRRQLQEIQSAGIEVLLAAYSPAPSARGDWARRGLAALVEALKESRAANRFYPMVGMYLDTEGLVRALGQPADLTSARGRQILYGAIREFYQHIPPEFRAEIGAGEQRGHPVVLAPPTGLAKWDAEFIEYANRAFSRDFGGARLIWMADPAWKSGGLSELEAYPPLSGEQRSVHEASGKAAVAVLSPGSCDVGASTMQPRSESRELREEWRQLLALSPAHVILLSWNDFVRGNHIAPTRQEGFTLVDTFSLLVSQEAEKVSRPVRLKKANLPPVMAPGAKATAELVLTNCSTQEIRSDERIGFDWRILDEKGEFTLITKRDVVPFLLPPGGSTRISVPISAIDSAHKSLRPGSYLIEFNLRRSSLPYIRASWLSRRLTSFRLPLRVKEPPEYAFTVLGTTLRSHLKSGATYAASLTLRNDGTKTWKPDKVRISNQWYRVEDELEASSAEQMIAVEGSGSVTPLHRDVEPGETVIVTANVETTAQGDPLVPWRRGDMWHYALAWVLEAEGKKIYPSRREGLETVYVVEEGLGSYFVDSTTPAEMIAGEEYTVDIVLTNAGADTWPARETELVYHWYFWDGSPASEKVDSTPLINAVKAGDSVKLSASVKAPAYGGPHYLVWDLKQGEVLASCSINAHINATLRAPVMVHGGPCEPIDLNPYCNIIAAASDRRRSSGDFDGLGNCFPLEALPPDLSGNTLEVYPSGYYVPRSGENPAMPRGITFRYPDKGSGLQKALVCLGQTIALEGQNASKIEVSRLHVLGAGTGAGLSGRILITFADGHTQTLPLAMSSWLEPPSHGETVGFIAPYLRTPRGDNPHQHAYLHHYALTLSRPGEIASITLPDNAEMKIFALTLESAASDSPIPVEAEEPVLNRVEGNEPSQ